MIQHLFLKGHTYNTLAVWDKTGIDMNVWHL